MVQFTHRMMSIELQVKPQQWHPSEGQHWWHWASQSPAGRAALDAMQIPIDPEQPWQDTIIWTRPIDSDDTIQQIYWRAQPWIDEDQEANDIDDQFGGAITAIRATLGEALAGVFYCEKVTRYLDAPPSYSDNTFIAVNHDGTCAVILQPQSC